MSPIAHSIRRAALCATLGLTAIALLSCGGKKTAPPTGSDGATGGIGGDRALVQLADVPDGLAFALSDGKAGKPQTVRVKPAAATALPAAAAQALLSRMRPLVG
ncbi:MAG: hypothetical protein AAGC55_19525, partial [Myxococcota bacterium]